jgi:broad specificity phosphatase PhoE
MSHDRTTTILIRHAESRPSPDIPEADWRLTSRGRRQAEELADRLATAGISAIVTSPYQRAIDTVQPLGKRLGCAISVRGDLHERELCKTIRDDWQELVARAWADFSFALPDCESGLACQKRMVMCIEGIVKEFAGQTVAVCSHGNAIGLLLNSIDPGFGHADWQNMRFPDVFWVEWRDGRGVRRLDF